MAPTKGRTPPPKPAELPTELNDAAIEKLKHDRAMARAEEFKQIVEEASARLRCKVVGIPEWTPDGTGGFRLIVQIAYGAE